ncbi:hypothetical protein WK81_28300 [Burkholderia ubonensis]|nr:hypothetical protein WK81_28300 [Burkholderia ubonensis]
MRDRGEPAPAALLLISPVDASLGGDTLATRRGDDPMIRAGSSRGCAGITAPARPRRAARSTSTCAACRRC